MVIKISVIYKLMCLIAIFMLICVINNEQYWGSWQSLYRCKQSVYTAWCKIPVNTLSCFIVHNYMDSLNVYRYAIVKQELAVRRHLSNLKKQV